MNSNRHAGQSHFLDCALLGSSPVGGGFLCGAQPQRIPLRGIAMSEQDGPKENDGPDIDRYTISLPSTKTAYEQLVDAKKGQRRRGFGSGTAITTPRFEPTKPLDSLETQPYDEQFPRSDDSVVDDGELNGGIQSDDGSDSDDVAATSDLPSDLFVGRSSSNVMCRPSHDLHSEDEEQEHEMNLDNAESLQHKASVVHKSAPYNFAALETKTNVESKQPSLDEILESTNALFEQIDDKVTITVKEILSSLMEEYQCACFDKTIKAAVRQRLIELVTASSDEADDEGIEHDGVGNDSAEQDGNDFVDQDSVEPESDAPALDQTAATTVDKEPMSLSDETTEKDLTLDNVLCSTDAHFHQAEDWTVVTVKSVVAALLVEYQCPKLTKSIKGAVRQRLVDLAKQATEHGDHETSGNESSPESLDLDDVLASTDALFEQAEDKSTVTVQHIFSSLSTEYNSGKLDKSVKAAVKKRLTALTGAAASGNEIDNGAGEESTSPTKTDKKTSGDGLINLEDVLASTDALFEQVEDKTTVTIKDIVTSLLAEYQRPKFSKSVKAAIRQRLVDLATMTAKESDEENNVDSDVGDSDRTDESDAESNHDEEYDSDEERPTSRSKRHKSTKPAVQRSKKSTGRVRSSKASQTKLALRVHAEQRRKRRLEELRVRNEELLLHQSAQDQERAAQIAAKFETNTDDLRMERMEKRLDLLQKLNQKRIIVCSESVDVMIKLEADVGDAAPTPADDSTTAVPEVSNATNDGSLNALASDSEDDDEMELEIEGGRSLSFNFASKSSFANEAPTRLDKAAVSKDVLSLLDKADARQLHNGIGKPKLLVSPGRNSMNARAALKHKLKNKQRTMGNMWLARELGYATEQEHLQECLNHVNTMREQVLVKEKERVQANERAALRQKMLLDEASPEETGNKNDDEESGSDEEYKDGDDVAGDEDEELAMAKELETEEPDNADELEATADEVKGCDADQATKMDDSTEEHAFVIAKGDTSQPNEVDVPIADDGDELLSKVTDPTSAHCPRIEDGDESPLETQVQTLLPNDSTGAQTQIYPCEGDEVASHAEVSIEATDDNDGNQEPTLDDDEKQEANDEPGPAADEMDIEDELDESSKSLKPKGPRNSAWKAMLQKDAEKAKKKKRSSLVEEEADEEEEEEVAGLEDFGFVVHKKKANDEDDDHGDFDEDDLEHVVDDVSDDEGDEAAGEKARKAMEAAEEKKRHQDMIRRMRDGYDGRRGGIAGGGAGARGLHRFDQLVAADNREDAKQLGLLNDDEMDSDNEGGDTKGADDEIEDEAALLDQMLKNRFLHRSSANEEENFSDDEEDDEPTDETGLGGKDDEELEQERLAKRFSKRARMHRLLENHGHEEEFSQALLLDEDTTLKLELQRMKNGLVRKRSQSSSRSNSTSVMGSKSSLDPSSATLTTSLLHKGGSLAIALQASRRSSALKTRTSFVRSTVASSVETAAASSFQKSMALSNHVVFHSSNSSQGRSQMSSSRGQSNGGTSGAHRGNNSAQSNKRPSSLFSHLAVNGFQKKARNN